MARKLTVETDWNSEFRGNGESLSPSRQSKTELGLAESIPVGWGGIEGSEPNVDGMSEKSLATTWAKDPVNSTSPEDKTV